MRQPHYVDGSLANAGASRRAADARAARCFRSACNRRTRPGPDDDQHGRGVCMSDRTVAVETPRGRRFFTLSEAEQILWEAKSRICGGNRLMGLTMTVVPRGSRTPNLGPSARLVESADAAANKPTGAFAEA